MTGSTRCASCPDRMVQHRGQDVGAIRAAQRASHRQTEAGGVCAECPSGWFQDQNVQASATCKACPAGYGAVVRITEDGTARSVNGSALCRDLNYISACSSSEQYLNDTSTDPADHTCEQCPPGGACGGDTAAWSHLGPLFGWWKIPEKGTCRQRVLEIDRRPLPRAYTRRPAWAPPIGRWQSSFSRTPAWTWPR